jgi:hypothetical protein
MSFSVMVIKEKLIKLFYFILFYKSSITYFVKYEVLI